MMRKLKFVCSDCSMEAIIEVLENPWEASEDEIIQACFHCGGDGAYWDEEYKINEQRGFTKSS